MMLSFCSSFGFFSDGMMGFGLMGWWMWFGLLLLGGAGYVVYMWSRPKRRVVRDDPLEAARLRYARGEITAEEYEEIVKRLSR